jgi:predicted small lipoprotein YifL
MARMNLWQLVVALGFALSLLAGCEQKGPAEKVGEKADKAVDQAGKAMQDAAKDAEKKVKDATK